MTIANIPSSLQSLPTLGIDDFRRSAELGEEVHVQVDGEQFKLIASGQTPSARSVAWVESEGSNATGMFVAALEGSFGGRLSKAIADELGLQPTAGKPLSSRVVMQALDMAETASGALAGVQFAEQLTQSIPSAKPLGKD